MCLSGMQTEKNLTGSVMWSGKQGKNDRMLRVSLRSKNLVILVPMRGEQGKKKGYCNEQFKRPYTDDRTVTKRSMHYQYVFIYK